LTSSVIAAFALLAFKVRPLRGIPSLLIDEAVPDIDVADVDLLGLLTRRGS
jgi:hypothetical protein